MRRRRDEAEIDEQRAAARADQRQRRHQRMKVVYGAEFDAMAEVFDVLDPIARRIAAEPVPTVYREDVRAVAAATHGLVAEVFAMVTLSDSQKAAKHLPERDRGRAVKLLCELPERPQPPVLVDDTLTTGDWLAALTSHVGTVSGRLSDLLQNARPEDQMRGALSVNQRLVNSLHELDTAALSLQRHLDRAEQIREEQAQARRRGTRSRKTDAVAELQRMGVRV
ncbi:hypothetical protein [Mycobacterium sp.]|uniref:hypothetical protein n=1 Tax=Mycobacterium sp. TaxID=1785 RepID=UPI003F9DDB71